MDTIDAHDTYVDIGATSYCTNIVSMSHFLTMLQQEYEAGVISEHTLRWARNLVRDYAIE